MIKFIQEKLFSKGILLRRLNIPYTKPIAIVEISNICNAYCVFCPYESIKNYSDKTFMNMRFEDSKKIFEIINELNIETVNFTPTSGDIFLNKEWFEILSYALQQHFIKEISFNTNAILLNKDNIEKLIQLPNINKIKYIAISLGGLDSTTYQKLFKVDKFSKVVTNVNLLLSKLHQISSTLTIVPNLHYTKNIKFSKKDVDRIYNKVGYKYFLSSGKDSSKTYYKISDVEEYEELNFPSSPYNKRELCLRLRYFRFTANGEVWLCGCVASETKDDNSLKVGHLNDSLDALKLNQAKIINQWFSYGEVPKICQDCSVYKPY